MTGAPVEAVAVVQTLAEAARAKGMAQTAREAEMTREGLYKALAPDGNPSYATVAKVARVLGFRLQVTPT